MSERLSLQWPMICVGGLRRLPFTGLLQLLNGWADARLRLAGRAAPAVLPPCRYCCSDSQARGHRWAACSHLLSDPEEKKKLALSKAAARTMDATIYQIIFGELGDLNCSLIDAFQDTFMENASLSFLSADGKMDFFLFLFSILRCVAFWIMESGISVRLFFFVLLYFPPPKVYIAMPQPMRLEPAGRGAAAGGLWRDPALSTSTGWSTTQPVRYSAVMAKVLYHALTWKKMWYIHIFFFIMISHAQYSHR